MLAKKTLSLWILLSAAAALQAEERSTVNFEALPDAVKATALHYLEPRQIGKITRIGGERLRFEFEVDKNENQTSVADQDVVIAANGKVMTLKRQVPYFALSFEQMQAIEQRYPGIKVDETEAVENHYFEVSAKQNGQALKLKVLEDNTLEALPDSQP